MSGVDRAIVVDSEEVSYAVAVFIATIDSPSSEGHRLMVQKPINESFIRWQTITLSQMTYAVNLILGFAVAVLGFQMTVLLNKDSPLSYCQKCVLSGGIISIGISVVLGIVVVINRLRDFRATMNAARLREDESNSEALEAQRILYRRLGVRTWRLFWCQIGAFGLGIVITMFAVLSILLLKSQCC